MTEYELREKLQNDFKLGKWKLILEELFSERIFYATPKLPDDKLKDRDAYKRLAQHVHHIGEVELSDGTSMAFIDVQLKKGATQLTRNRVGLRQLVDSEVIAGVRDAAIIVYHQPDYKEWRISFYSEQYVWDEKEGIVKVETNPKRYTFVVGGNETCRTPAERLYSLIDRAGSVALNDVMKAFSVEKVSKRFFDEYKHQYDKFVSYLTGKVWTKDGEQDFGEKISQFNFFFQATSDHEKEARDFVKKLLGRIVFLYFVQKKGWLGASSEDFTDGSQKFIRELFNQVNNHNDPDQFYSTWLRKLFFEGLNDKEDLSFEMPDSSTCYMPFLNGGLFEQDETDLNTEGLPLPDKLFSNPDYREVEEDKYDKPNKRGFLDFLDAFNFTIHEDSPGDHTIAVDPEMLGHIFENLLEDNKEKGAYYTPKPVVHYMCQESIIEFLHTELADDEPLRANIEALIKDQETGGIDHFYDEILTALKEVKVCDPAIGSGAFPMGILQEIYQTVETIYYASPDSVRAIWELENGNWDPAAVKKQIIQHSIYGVDIEQGAVDIARLRFWLSLIVDEEKPTPLPNLEYKIQTGNSLLSTISFNGEDEPIEIDWKIDASSGGLWGQDELEKKQDILKEIHAKQDLFFNSEEIDKESLGVEIRNLKIELLINQLQMMINTQGLEEKPHGSGKHHKQRMESYLQTQKWKKTVQKLEKLMEKPDEPFNHFEWELDFPEVLNPIIAGDDAGFDVVIGNPPYVLQAKSKFEKFRDQYPLLEGKPDLYRMFLEKSLSLHNQQGVISYLLPNTLLTIPSAYRLRDHILKNYKINSIVNYDDTVFENASVNSIVVILQNTREEDSKTKCYLLDEKDSDFTSKNLNKVSQEKWIENEKSEWNIFISDAELKVIEKLKAIDKKIGDSDNGYKISLGIQAYHNTIHTKKQIKSRFLHSDSKKTDEYILELGGRHINRYNVSIPNEKTFVDFGSEMYTKPDIEYFSAPRVIVREISGKSLTCTYTEDNFVLKKSCYIILGPSHKLKFLTGLLNSRLVGFWVNLLGDKANQRLFPRVTMSTLKSIPYVECSKYFPTFSNIVDYLTFLNEKKPSLDGWTREEAIKIFEKLIDGMIYELYFQESFEKRGINLSRNIEDEFQPIANIANDQIKRVIKNVLKATHNRDAKIFRNMKKVWGLEEVKTIENALS